MARLAAVTISVLAAPGFEFPFPGAKPGEAKSQEPRTARAFMSPVNSYTPVPPCSNSGTTFTFLLTPTMADRRICSQLSPS